MSSENLKKVRAWLEENEYIEVELPVGSPGWVKQSTRTQPSHKGGLPPGIYVKCQWTNIDGLRSCLVTTAEVIIANLHIPYMHGNWQIIQRRGYGNTDELKALLDREIPEPKGCW